MNDELRILILQDVAADADLLEQELRESGLAFISRQGNTEEFLLEQLQAFSPHVVLADHGIRNANGAKALQLVKERRPAIPVIIVTHSLGEEVAVECLRDGASDYVLKSNLRRLSPAVKAALDGKRLRGEKTRVDITERELAEAAHRELERSLGAIFESSSDGILLADPDTRRFRLANRAICRMLGYDPEEMQHLSFGDIHPGQGPFGVLEVFERPTENHSQLATDVPVRKKDDSIFYADINVTRVALQGRAYVMGTFRDTTERRQIQISLAQADRMATVGMLAAGVVHEINNPLTYVLYNLESLLEELPQLSGALYRALFSDSTETQPHEALPNPHGIARYASTLDELVERAREALQGAHRVRDILRDLKTFSRVEETRRVPVSVNKVVEAAVSMAFNEIKYRARLVKQYGDLPPLLANEGRLSQVFLNLLINAAHSIDEGDVKHNEIRLRTWSEMGRIWVEVSDTGRGIPPEHFERLFEPFYTTKAAGVGSGLGLSICRKIVTDYGGHIQVDSEVGKGTRFVVSLPLRSSDEPGARVQARRDERPTASAAGRGRVLLIDDESAVIRAMRRMLEKEHDVVVANSGEQARTTLRRDAGFDVILCDLMMPDLTGMDLHDWIAQTHPSLTRRMVFMTGGVFTSRASEFLKAVPNIRLEKPIERENLLEIVRNLVVAKN